MIPARMLTQDVALVHRAPGTVNEYNRAELAETGRELVKGWMQNTATQEATEPRITATARWVLFVNPPVAPLRPWDLVEWNGRTFTVEGSPMEYRTPRNGVHHLEVPLQEVIE